MMNSRVNVFLLLVMAIVAFGCQSGHKSIPVSEKSASDSNSSPVFAESNLLNITVDMMAEEFQKEQLPVTKDIDSSIARNAVYEMLLDTILAQDADKFDLSAYPNLQKQHDDMWRDYLIRIFFKKYIVDSVSVNDSDVYAAYEEYKDKFFVPKKYRAQHIVVSGENLKNSVDSTKYANMTDEQIDSIARAEVVELRQRAIDGANFDTLAMMYSQDPGSADKGGDLGYFELSQMVAPFDSTVEHTPVDSISGVIKTRFGWHVLKVLDVAEEHYTPIDSVFGALKALVQRKAADKRGKEFMDSVSENSVVIIDTSIFTIDDSLVPPDTVVAVINPDDKKYGNDTLTYSDYREHVGYFAQQLGLNYPLQLEDKLLVVKTMANKYNIIRAAQLLGYNQDPDLTKWSRWTKTKYAVATKRKKLFNDGYEPKEEELKQYYDGHVGDYQVERPIKVQHIVFADSNLAEYVRDVAMSGVDFMDLVDQYYPGDPEIKRVAADLGYIGPKDMPKSFWRAAMITRVGEVSKPIKTQYGYHIIKVLDKHHSMPFETARSRVRTKLMKQHKQEVRDSYVESHIGGPPKIHWEYFEKLYYKKTPPPTLPGIRVP